MADIGRLFMLIGAGLFVFGLLVILSGRLPWLGNLPGDFRFESNGFALFAPCGTMIVVSVVLTIVLNVILRILR